MYSAVIVAAGSGKRFKEAMNKVLYQVHDKPIIMYTIEAFRQDPLCKEIVLVAKEDELAIMEKFHADKVVPGGTSRQESVLNGLKAANETYVLVHDGARPYVPLDVLNRVTDALKVCDVVGTYLQVFDTLKEVKDNTIVGDVNRDNVISLQTPQAFKKSVLLKAYASVDKVYPCDLSLVKAVLGQSVELVLGDRRMMKVTTLDDLSLMELILNDAHWA